jgi:predicted ester cyclase
MNLAGAAEVNILAEPRGGDECIRLVQSGAEGDVGRDARRRQKETKPASGAETAAAPHKVKRDGLSCADLLPRKRGSGPAGQKRVASDFREAFPDLRFEVEFVVAQDDLVAARWTAEGTNSGPWGAQPPTGRRARFSVVNIFRFDGGKVVEIWNHRDDLGLMEQLGASIFAGARPG